MSYSFAAFREYDINHIMAGKMFIRCRDFVQTSLHICFIKDTKSPFIKFSQGRQHNTDLNVGMMS